ncbi:hypothetical protein E2562_038343 [Oryza meyeriana var. granulata]|uniref:non-specific serine/threonine protein kinase n=1 Tax=Oryza meyeriana var. granulata TaxID=110450 RepID=A0A6G1FGI7_9ORYZ|nr:hypothetical protein E2562_038343 [Oryza meyeriana var. granulata]
MPILYLLFVLMLSSASSISYCTEHDRNSLLRFLGGLSQDGGLAASWRDGKDYCSWEGITCSSSTASKAATVTDVLLASKKLKGSISPTLGSLPGLLRLNLSHNSLSGSLPSEIMSSGSIVVLDVLNISSNKFAAEFPSLGAVANLVALNGSNNSFTGMLPVAPLCRASPSLALLDLSHNRFTGEVSLALASYSMLKVPKAGRNNLSGILPFELFDMTSLEHLSFPNNGLEGELDGSHMAKLSNLVTLDLGGNCFHGKIPESIGQLNKLEKLSLYSNKMSGNLSPSLSNCTLLTTIDLKINSFSGDLGNVDFSALHNLKTLDLLANNFSGIIPESIYSCSNLTALRCVV